MADRFETALHILDDERFEHIRRIASERLLTYDEFVGMKMPEGSSPDAVWAVLTLLRKQTAVYSPVCYLDPTSDPSEVWYTVPRRSEALIREIVAHSADDSLLSRSIRHYPYNSLDLQDQIEELLACVAWDGSRIDYESARDIVVGTRKAERPVEHVIENYCEIMKEVVSGTSTLSGAEPAYRRLVCGAVEDVRFDVEVARAFDTLLAGAEFALSAPMVCESTQLQEILWNHRSFGEWNAVFGSLLRKLYFIRAGHPLFSLLPMSKLMLDWWDHKFDPHVIPLPEQNWRTSPDEKAAVGQSVDATPFIVTYIHLMHEALQTLEQRVGELERRERHLRSIVRGALTLNYRQRDVLLAALEDPDREFRIVEHQATYQSAYATARSDLLRLVSLGFMNMKQQGKKLLIFRMEPDFKKTVEQRLATPAAQSTVA